MEQTYTLNLSDKEIRYITYCWLYLSIISLADISDEQGNFIITKAWVRLKSHRPQSSKKHPTAAFSFVLDSLEKSITIVHMSK
jgi:hypothetical protein